MITLHRELLCKRGQLPCRTLKQIHFRGKKTSEEEIHSWDAWLGDNVFSSLKHVQGSMPAEGGHTGQVRQMIFVI